MRYRFYYEYEEEDQQYAIMEEDGGYELGQYYDVCHFWVLTLEDAQIAVTLLNKGLQEK